MKRRNVLGLVDGWCDHGVDNLSPDTLSQFRECCRLLGVPAGFGRKVDESNFQQKAKALKTRRRAGSKALALALLRSREYEDAENLGAAVRVFERFTQENGAKFFVDIAQHEIARIGRRSREIGNRTRTQKKMRSTK